MSNFIKYFCNIKKDIPYFIIFFAPNFLLNQICFDYKNHKLQKVFVGIAPPGCLIFIPNSYNGRQSDNHVVNGNGFFDSWIPD